MSGFALQLADIAPAIGAQMIGGNVGVTGVSTDSRSIAPGDLFVAIRGDNFDGHKFAEAAIARGAVAAITSTEIVGLRIPQLVVDDTRFGYGRLAKFWRRQFSAPTLALTGSNGKTTVKEMLRSILAVHTGDAAAVLATEGNLNNDIGVPQMMLQQSAVHRYAVFEMGMNHLGEIDYLSHLVEPDVALVIMAGTAHIGELGSREAIAQAKGEIYGGLKPGGMAVINMHDRFGGYWKELACDHRTLLFGIAPEDDVVGDFGDEVLSISYREEQIAVRLQLPGRHNQTNALAAASGAIALGVPLATIKQGLETFTGVAGRLRSFTGHNSATIIDDTYNANPDSVKAAIRVIAARTPPRFLVLGDMGELGSDAPAMHREVGAFARQAGIENLLATGPLSRETVAAFGEPGRHFETTEELVAALLPQLDANTSVLVKGSRFMRLERVVARLVPDYHGHH
jgi:UDP-N-acetylmuramoyl-tripeptide--D-alanyl-D-alanine ligase